MDSSQNIVCAGAVTASSFISGTSPPALTPGTGGAWGCAEGTVPSVGAATGVDVFYCDSTQHGPLLSRNNGSYLPLPQGPASTTSGHVASWNSTNGGLLADGGAVAANLVVASSPGAGIAHFAGSTQTVTSSTIATADIAANAVTSAKMAVVNTRRVCDIAVGDTTASAITTSHPGPQTRTCFIPAASTIVEMDVAADAGTPNVIVGNNAAGSVTNIVSGALATASAGAIACSNTGGTTGIDGATTCTNTLQNTTLNAGSYLELVSGTAGGTAKLMTIHVIYTIN